MIFQPLKQREPKPFRAIHGLPWISRQASMGSAGSKASIIAERLIRDFFSLLGINEAPKDTSKQTRLALVL